MNNGEFMRGRLVCLRRGMGRIIVPVAVILGSSNAMADVTFQGVLTDSPCQVDPASGTQDVSFQDTPALTFNNTPGKTYTQSFQVRLMNCNAAAQGKVVQLKFSGTEEAALPGFLAVTGNNAGKLGIAIVDTDGSSQLKPGSIQSKGAGDVVNGSTMTLNFGAFVQATPQAIAQKSVTPGDYAATTTFELDYQ